jgi:hypothetical protein
MVALLVALSLNPTHAYGDPYHLTAPGYANFRATFDRIVMPQRGKHPDPRVRPKTTVEGSGADTASAMFWEITGLVQLSKADRIAITSLSTVGQTRPLAVGFVPRGPMLVKAAFL